MAGCLIEGYSAIQMPDEGDYRNIVLYITKIKDLLPDHTHVTGKAVSRDAVDN